MKKYYLILIIFALASCSIDNKENNDKILQKSTLIDIPINEEKFTISDNNEDVHYLTLENDEMAKISTVSKIEFFDKQIFIFDVQQNKIFMFQDDGSFLTQIGKKGNGPNEYLYLSDFFINKSDSHLELLDVGSKKILQVSLSNKVSKEIKIPFYCDKFLKTKQGGYLFFANNQQNGKGGESFNIILTDGTAKIINKLLPIPPENHDLIISEPFTFTAYRSGAIFSLPIDNTIYHARNNSVFHKYNISFGKHNTPVDILASLKQRGNQDKIQLQMKIFNDIIKSGNAYSIHSVLENESFLFFQFRRNKNLYSALYDKRTKKIKTGMSFSNKNGINTLGQPVAINNKDELVTVLFPYELYDQLDYLKTKQQKMNINGNEFENLSKLVNSVGQFDNPILKFTKLSKL